MKAYFRLRRRILGRLLAELGWVRLLLLGGFVLAVAGNGLFVLARHPLGQWAVPAVVGLLAASLHRHRSDLTFLHLMAPGYRRWLALEYAAGSAPVAVVLLGFGLLLPALLTVLLAALAATLPAAKARAARRRGRSAFRSEAYEWVSGFRQIGAWLWWLGLLAGAVWWRQHGVAPALALGLWVLLLTPLYGTAEPWPMLLPVLGQPGPWLMRRIGWAVLYFFLTAAPFVWLLGTGVAGWLAAVAMVLWGAAVLGLVVLAKYAFYPNGMLIRLTQVATVALAVLAVSSPVYVVLLAAALLGLLWKSRSRLGTYRPDGHVSETQPPRKASGT